MKLDALRKKLRKVPRARAPLARPCATCGEAEGTCKMKFGREKLRRVCQTCAIKELNAMGIAARAAKARRA